jgi:hypothetical protein
MTNPGIASPAIDDIKLEIYKAGTTLLQTKTYTGSYTFTTHLPFGNSNLATSTGTGSNNWNGNYMTTPTIMVPS